MSRALLRLPLAAGLCGLALVASQASAGVVEGTVTYQSGWKTVATLQPGVVVQHEQIRVAGYDGTRTLTRVSWTIGNPHVELVASPTALPAYDGADQSFAEGQISRFGTSVGALAGINGDTFCEWCGQGWTDTLHGLLVENRLIYSLGANGPEVGYTPAGGMIMGTARAVPFELALPGEPATIAVWNRLTLPSGHAIGADQVAVYTTVGSHVALPAGTVGLVLAGATTETGGATSTPHTLLMGLIRMAVPYADASTKVTGAGDSKEWVDAYRISQTGGSAVTATLPVAGELLTGGSGVTVAIPAGGVVVVARGGTPAATGLASAASAGDVSVRLDDRGWGSAASIMDGKFQMVRGGVAQTTYPGWPDSWPWYCGGAASGGCVRTAVATAGTKGWMIVVSGAWGEGLTMPDFGRVLAQLGATNAMGFDANTHAEFWRRGGSPIDADGRYEPPVPATTTLRSP
jgi:hypothetical protein